MGKVLSFDTGGVEYTINGTGVRFNPASATFLEDYRTLLADLSALHEELADEINKLYEGIDADAMGPAAEMDAEQLEEAAERGDLMLEVTRKYDLRMREVLDAGPFETVDGGSLSDELFGRKALADNAGGQPLWLNFMECIASEVEGSVGDSRRAAGERTQVRDPRYRRMVEKYRSR